MSETRPVLDVSELPETVFGHRHPVWWATAGFILVEGTTLAVAAFSYFYLRRNFTEWPPAGTPQPALLLPTINLVIIVAIIVPMQMADSAAKAFDKAGVMKWLGVAVVLSLLALLLRGFEFALVHERWDENAYGSIVWFILGLHSTLLVVDFFESGAILAIFRMDREEEKHFSDVEDAVLYQWFLSLVWVPLYATVYLSPRII